VFACICRAVTSDEVSTAIDNGAGTLAQVAKATGACTSCGTCKERIRGMLGERGGSCPLAALRAPAAV
jgi:bacterioferritin-associated ferredoxin